MKVALLSDCYPPRTGGIESQVSDLAVQLTGRGHEVEVLTATPGSGGERGGAEEIAEGVRIHRLATRLPGEIPVNPMASSAARRILANGGFDVGHAHLGVVSPFGWDMARVATGLGLPTALTFHCLLDRAAPALGPLLRTWSTRGAVFSAVSSLAAKGVERALSGEPVALLPNGIDPDAWPVGAVGPGGGPLRVVTASRLAPRKRVSALLRVVARVVDRLGRGALTVDVYGEGPLRGLLERRVESMGLRGVVTFRGNVDRIELARAYRGADAYLSPTRLEAFGIAALEARTAGLPVLARADSGVSEVVTHGTSGLLAADDDGLADALGRLVGDETLRRRLADHNVRTPPAQTWDRVVDLAVREYHRAGA